MKPYLLAVTLIVAAVVPAAAGVFGATDQTDIDRAAIQQEIVAAKAAHEQFEADRKLCDDYALAVAVARYGAEPGEHEPLKARQDRAIKEAMLRGECVDRLQIEKRTGLTVDYGDYR